MSAHLWGRGELETEFHHVDKSTGPACIMKPHIKTLDTKAQLLPSWHPRGLLSHTLPAGCCGPGLRAEGTGLRARLPLPLCRRRLPWGCGSFAALPVISRVRVVTLPEVCESL